MYLEKLSLTDFRSYAQVDLSLEPGVTVLVGSNGIGKTNLMEAIGYLATLNSHRVSTDAPLLRFGAERAMIRAKLVRGEQSTVLELEINAAPGQPRTDQPEQSGPRPGPARASARRCSSRRKTWRWSRAIRPAAAGSWMSSWSASCRATPRPGATMTGS